MEHHLEEDELREERCRQEALDDLLCQVEALLTRYVVFRPGLAEAQRTAVVLWIAHAHALAAFDVTAYLNVRSAEPRSGKTRLIECVGELVPSPFSVIGTTSAALFRMIADGCTLLLDETDSIFGKQPTPGTEDLRGVLNGGYRRGATVPRCVGGDHGKIRVEHFPIFCPQAPCGHRAATDDGRGSQYPDRDGAGEVG
jgi:hypothetical protein